MKLKEVLGPDAIAIQLSAGDKQEVLEELVSLLVDGKVIKSKGPIVKALMARESLGSTGIGQGIAIPHIKSALVKKPIAALGISKKGVDFNALDGEPVYIIFLLISPEDEPGPHLKALARVSRMLRDRHFRDSLRAASDAVQVSKIIDREDKLIP